MIEKTHRKRIKKTTKCYRMKQKEELKKEKKKKPKIQVNFINLG
jgi:hypothetical protein